MTADVLVVDGANVVGSRPDGWWKDRAGAADRLHRRLQGAELDAARLILVLEGRARAGVPAGVDGTVETVHATADGDSAIAGLVGRLRAEGVSVQVVTADRGLAAIVEDFGAEVRGPRWLLERLDA